MALRYLGRASNGEASPAIIGTSSSPATLTATYSGNQTTMSTGVFKVATFYVFYTPAASSRNLSIQVEGSADRSNWAKKIIFFETDTSGESNMLGHVVKLAGTTGGSQYTARYMVPTADEFLRISVKEDGSSSFGTVFVQGSGQLNTLHG